MDVVDSDLGKDPDYLIDHDNVDVYDPWVVLFVFIVLIMEFGSRDSVGKFHEELDYKRTVQSVVVILDTEPEFAGKICY